MMIGNVRSQKGIFVGANYDAIVGLAYPTLAEKGVKSFVEELIDNKLVDTMYFAFYMTTEKSGIPPELTFGYIDETKFDGEIHWMPIEYKHMYGV